MLRPATNKSWTPRELDAIQAWVNRTFVKVRSARMPIRIELTTYTSPEGEDLYRVQDFLHKGNEELMTFNAMPTWMQERFALLLVNAEHMFEIEDVGFCYEGKTFYVKGEETNDDEA